MKRPKVSVALDVLSTVLLVLGFVLLMIAVGNEHISYSNALRWRLYGTHVCLDSGRKNIRLFAEETGRFPKSLAELNEYIQNRRDKMNRIRFPLESISDDDPNTSEHNVLDGTGGLYYNPETGVLKVNLTKPLKSYWRFYFGKGREEVPADW